MEAQWALGLEVAPGLKQHPESFLETPNVHPPQAVSRLLLRLLELTHSLSVWAPLNPYPAEGSMTGPLPRSLLKEGSGQEAWCIYAE